MPSSAALTASTSLVRSPSTRPKLLAENQSNLRPENSCQLARVQLDYLIEVKAILPSEMMDDLWGFGRRRYVVLLFHTIFNITPTCYFRIAAILKEQLESSVLEIKSPQKNNADCECGYFELQLTCRQGILSNLNFSNLW